MLGQIIVVNGTSGSGKSTTCERFVQRSEDFWLLTGIDPFLGSVMPRVFGHHGARAAEGISAVPRDPNQPDGDLCWHFSEQAYRAFGVFHEWVAASSREGVNIILDHLMMTEPAILQDCVRRWAGLPVLFVNLKPPYEVLMKRIAERAIGQRFSNSSYSDEQLRLSRERLDRLRPWFYEATYANDCYDLQVDTEACGPDEVCELIEARLQQDSGRAFQQLHAKWLT